MLTEKDNSRFAVRLSHQAAAMSISKQETIQILHGTAYLLLPLDHSARRMTLNSTTTRYVAECKGVHTVDGSLQLLNR